MATHSSILGKSWTEEPGGLQSMESQRAGHYLVTSTFSYYSYKVIENLPIQ